MEQSNWERDTEQLIFYYQYTFMFHRALIIILTRDFFLILSVFSKHSSILQRSKHGLKECTHGLLCFSARLDVYICDYLIRKKWIRTAESFIAEGKVSPKNVVGIVDTPEGHLLEWWSIFWETHLASGNLEAQQIKTNEQQLQMQQLQLMSQSQLHSETAAGHLEAQQIKTNEQQLKMQQLQLNREARLQRSVSNHPPHGLNPGIGGLTLKRSGIDQIQPGFGAHVQHPLLQSANQFQPLPHQQQLRQIPAQATHQILPGFGAHVQQPLLQSANQFQPLSHQQLQQILEQVQAQGNIGNSSYGDRGSSNVKDDGDGMDLFGTSKQNLSDHATAIGISFSEAGCMRKSNSEVVCCHFSSDGKFLASAGHDKQVFLWNFETRQIESTPVGHLRIISEVRFRPNSTLLATSSLDHTVRLWDAGNPSFSMPYYGTSPLLSLDFHPKKNDLLCSCGNNNEIRIWNIDQNSCIRVSKGGTARVRFQPRIGHLLAAASGNAVTLFDFETDREVHKLQGHSAGVNTVCWDTNGDYVTSVSQDSVKVWSVASGNCVRELNSSGHMYRSCVFHPRHSNVLVIGLNQSLALWNMAENKWMTIPAHDCLIPALAASPVTGMIASASHDKSVKIWK